MRFFIIVALFMSFLEAAAAGTVSEELATLEASNRVALGDGVTLSPANYGKLAAPDVENFDAYKTLQDGVNADNQDFLRISAARVVVGGILCVLEEARQVLTARRSVLGSVTYMAMIAPLNTRIKVLEQLDHTLYQMYGTIQPSKI